MDHFRLLVLELLAERGAEAVERLALAGVLRELVVERGHVLGAGLEDRDRQLGLATLGRLVLVVLGDLELELLVLGVERQADQRQAQARQRLALLVVEVDRELRLVDLVLADLAGDRQADDVAERGHVAALDRAQLGVLAAELSERLVDGRLGDVQLAALDLEALVVLRRDFATDLDDRGERERLALLDRGGLLDARLGDRGEVVLLVRAEERLAHELVGDLGVDALAVDLLEHRPRHLALAEALERDALGELAILVVELLAHRLPRDLDEHLLFDGRHFFDADLHKARLVTTGSARREPLVAP